MATNRVTHVIKYKRLIFIIIYRQQSTVVLSYSYSDRFFNVTILTYVDIVQC